MKAALGDLPPAAHDDEWAYEIKWDGYRTLAFVDDGRVRLQSSNGLDVTVKYPELAGFGESVNAPSAIIDGELLVLDSNGHPNFGLLQQHSAQVVFYPFDVLQIAGTDTVSLPYEQRRALLESLVEPGGNWMVPAFRIGDGAALYVLPEFAWSRRVNGIFGNRLAQANARRAHAVLVAKPGGYTVSVRAPVSDPKGADVLCAAFETGGGRKGAAGINLLPLTQLSAFVDAFRVAYP